jgi:hypothetical protein
MQIVQLKNGIIHKGNYGALYDAGTDTVTEVNTKPAKRGRPSLKDAVLTYTMPNDLFGRVPANVPNGVKGRVIIGKASV